MLDLGRIVRFFKALHTLVPHNLSFRCHKNR